MADIAGFLRTVEAAFPVAPIPARVVSLDHEGDYEFPDEINRAFAGRSWTEISMSTWANTGSSAVGLRDYFEPPAYLYYLPSLLVGAADDEDWVMEVVEALCPSNRRKAPKGEWWSSFAGLVTPGQVTAVRAFLALALDPGWSRDALVYEPDLIAAAELWAGPLSPDAAG